MPFADNTSPEAAARIEGVDPHAFVAPELTWRPSIADSVSASIGIDNTVGSVARHMGDRWSLWYARQSGWDTADDDYDAFDDGEVLRVVNERPELARAFAHSSSRFESQMIRDRIDREDEARETMAQATAGGHVAMFAAGLIDPVNLLPLGAWARAFKLGRGLTGALEGAGANLASSGLSEAILQGTQYTRTAEESLTNMGASAILGGVLGGGIAMVSPAARQPMAEGLARQFKEARDALNGVTGEGLQGGGGSGGAAAVRGSNLADETRVFAYGANTVGELPIVGNPIARLSESPSVMVRQVARDLTESAYHFQGEGKGIAAPQAVETRAKLWEGPLAVSLGRLDELFAQYRFGGKARASQLRAGLQDLTGRGGGRLTYEQFMQRVTYAARRGDADPIPEVDAGAKVFREAEDRLKNAAIDVGLFTEDVHVTTAESHVHRVYNREKIKAQRPAFEQVIFDHVAGLKQAGAETISQVNAWAKIRDRAKANIDRIEAVLKDQQQFDVAGMRAEGQAKRRLANELQREATIRGKRVEQLRRRLANAQARQIKPTDRLPETDDLVRLLDDVRNLKEPQRLIERVRAMGGIRDTNGELKAAGFLPIKKRNGKVLNTKDARLEIIDPDATGADGRGLDQVARQLSERSEGYLPLREAGDEDMDALVAALHDDAHGAPRYAEWGPDGDEIARYREAQNTKAELERQGIDIRWADERIAAELGLIENYVPDTPAARERLRQGQFYERRVSDDLAAERKAHADVVERLGKTSKEAADTLGRAQRMRGNIDAMKRERSASIRAFEKFTKLVDAHQEIQVMSDADLRDVARQVADKVLGYEDAGAIEVDGSRNLRGAVLERSLTIPDHRIEGWLENNAERVLRTYTRQMGADVELTRSFGRPDMRDQFEEIKQHYARVREGVTDQKALTELDKQMAQDINNLAAIRDRIRGTYGVPKDPDQMLVRSFRVVRAGNYLRLMGGATTAAIPDPAFIVMTHGLGRVFGNGLRPMIASLAGSKGFRAAREEVKRWSVGLDYVLDTRAHALADIGDDFGRHSKFERGVEWVQNKFGIVNLLSGWTAGWSQLAGVVGQTRILQEVERFAAGKATPAEIRHLAYLGIDHTMATRLQAMQREHAMIEPGLRVANTERWADKEAVTAIRAALRKEVDVTIMRPGAGDKPLWMSTQWGQTVGQFKSFGLSAMARITARGLQQHDAAALQGMVMATTLGMLAYYVKTRDEDIAWDNPLVWIKEGIDRSGLVGWVGDALNTQEKLMGGLGINTAIGAPSARYMSRNAMGAILGPSAGLGEDAARLLANLGQGNWSAADTHRIRKMLPAQNLLYLRWLFDEAEKGVNEAFGVPDRRQQFRRRNDY